MAACMHCDSPEMILDRNTGEMTCANCKRTSLVGTPDSYGPRPESTYNKRTGEFTQDEFFPNSIAEKG